MTRDFSPQKPDPAPVLHIREHWGLPPRHVMVVGDHSVDIVCGQSAGTGTCELGRARRRRSGKLFKVKKLEHTVIVETLINTLLVKLFSNDEV